MRSILVVFALAMGTPVDGAEALKGPSAESSAKLVQQETDNAASVADASPRSLEDWVSECTSDPFTLFGAAVGVGVGLLLLVFGRQRKIRGIWALCVLVGCVIVGAAAGYLLGLLLPLIVIVLLVILFIRIYRATQCKSRSSVNRGGRFRRHPRRALSRPRQTFRPPGGPLPRG